MDHDEIPQEKGEAWKQIYKPEEDDGTIKNASKVEGSMSVAF